MPVAPAKPSDHDLVKVAYRLTADLSKPNAAIYWADLTLSAVAGYGAFFISVTATNTALMVGAAAVAVLALYRCILFIHELTHLRRRTPRFFWIGWHLIVGIPMLLPSFLYEGIHNRHHNRTQYGTAEDPEYLPLASRRTLDLILMVPISLLEPALLVLRFLIVIPLAALIPPLRGIVMERFSAMVMNPEFKRTEPPEPRAWWLAMEAACTLFAWSVAALVIAGIVPLRVPLTWLAVWSIIAFTNMARTLVAHHYGNDDGHEIGAVEQLLDTVNVPPPGLLPFLWAPVGLRYHGLHHLLPNLPYHSLGAAHRRLVELLPVDSAYRATLHPRAGEVLALLVRNQRRAMAQRASQAAQQPAE